MNPSTPSSRGIDHFDDDLDFTVEEDALLLPHIKSTQVQSPRPHETVVAGPTNSPQKQRSKPRVPWNKLLALSSAWFGWSVLWMPLLVVLVPHQIVQIAGEEGKGSSLGMTLLLGSLSSLIASPVFGAVSDSCRHPMGRRRPFMVIGTVLATGSLIVMSVASSLGVYAGAFFVLSIANNMILAPYSALVPDVVPEEQRGIAAGWLGGFSMFGFMCGGLVTYKLDVTGVIGCYLILIAVHDLAMFATIYFVEEVPLQEEPPPFVFREFCASFVKPLHSSDFRLLFLTRFLIQMGSITVQEYLQYYVKDAIGPVYEINGVRVADSAERAVSLLFVPLLLGAFFSSVISGIISDRLGGRRKFLVYISGATMTVCCVMFSITRSYSFDMFLGFVFGLGYGAFAAIDWAMATDVLPNADEFAKDMGVWSLAFVLPQVLAAPIAGNLLDYFEKIAPQIHLGYSIIFLLAVVYYSGGTYFVKFIQKVK